MGSWVLAFPACDEGERPFRVPAPRGSLPPRGYRGVLQGRQFAGLSDLQWVGGGSNLCGPEFPGQCGGFAAAVFDPQRLRPFDIPRACEAWPHGRTSVPCPSLVQHFLVMTFLTLQDINCTDWCIKHRAVQASWLLQYRAT